MNFDYKENVKLKKEPNGNLEDYLKLLNREQLNAIADFWNELTSSLEDSECIELIVNNLINDINEIIASLPSDSLIEFRDFLNGKIKKVKQNSLFQCGLIYIYKNNYYIPDDIKKLCQDKITDEVIIDSSVNYAIIYIKLLLFVYGIISIDDVITLCQKEIKIINKDKFIVKLKEIYKVLNIDNKEYFWNEEIPYNDEFAEFARNRINFNLTLSDVTLYTVDLFNGIKNIARELNIKDKKFFDEYFVYAFPKQIDANKITDYFADKYNLSKNKKEKFRELVKHLERDIIYWEDRGHHKIELKANKMILTKMPKDNKLKSYLEVLNKDGLNILFSDYDVTSIKDLIPKILNEFYIYDNSDINNDDINYYELINGFYFIYKGKKMVPDEMLKAPVIQNVYNIIHHNYAVEYVLINGIIARKKLQSILKEYHNLDYTLKQLDEQVKEYGITIAGDYYYYLADTTDFEKDLILKNKSNDYKILNDESINYMEVISNFSNKLKSIGRKYHYDESIMNELIGSVLFLLHLNMFNEEFLDELAQNNGKLLNKELIKEVTLLANEYKYDFPLWNKNGYTMNEIISKPKVGRNDPCICGSGKKYKKCCGK